MLCLLSWPPMVTEGLRRRSRGETAVATNGTGGDEVLLLGVEGGSSSSNGLPTSSKGLPSMAQWGGGKREAEARCKKLKRTHNYIQ